MANPNHPKYRRIVVQIDTSSSYSEVFHVAVDIAVKLGAELHGVFVEDKNLLNIGGLDFVREFSQFMPTAQNLDSSRLEEQLKALARRARSQLEQEAVSRNITAGFHTVREEFGSESATIVADVDLIIIERTSRSLLPSTLFLLPQDKAGQQAVRPILLLKGDRTLSGPLVVLCDSQGSLQSCLNVGSSLVQTEKQEILVLPCIATASDDGLLVENLKGIARDAAANIRIASPVKPEAEVIFSRLSASNNLLILARNGTLTRDRILLQKLIESRHPILFV
ncbi:universal stress protein [Sneathiella sp.]|uniref:universal stress protein n=1 Tax=Sneathiella sp. TaxID=1964365 RepID=UPI00356220E3